jgi:endogenous inhibitor of DNA gyrase (YacG/DUF329 family)
LTSVTAPIYGYCPTCKKEGIERNRNPRGPIYCSEGHAYIFKHWNTARIAIPEDEAQLTIAVPDENCPDAK